MDNTDRIGIALMLLSRLLTQEDKVTFMAAMSTLFHFYAEEKGMDSVVLANETILNFEEFEDFWNALSDRE